MTGGVGQLGTTSFVTGIIDLTRRRGAARLLDVVAGQSASVLQHDQTGHRGRTADPLYRIRQLLRRSANHDTPPSWTRLLAGLDVGDTFDEQLAWTWIAAQDLRLIFHCLDRPCRAGSVWMVYCADSNIPELIRLATTIDSWRTELLAYFTTTGGISNGRTEAINLVIKKVKRVVLGFRDFDNYRLRLLLHCGVD